MQIVNRGLHIDIRILPNPVRCRSSENPILARSAADSLECDSFLNRERVSVWHYRAGVGLLRSLPFRFSQGFDSTFYSSYTRHRFKTNNRSTQGPCQSINPEDFVAKKTYQWAASGDVSAFFGLMLDNIAGLVLAFVVLLNGNFGFPVDFALRYMVPGTAIGVLIGDLLFFWLAFRYASRTGKTDVTAMPLGLDTPSTLGMALFVIGPAFKGARDGLIQEGVAQEEAIQTAAMQAWEIGICALLIMGLIKLVAAFGSNWIRRAFPRAGLLGSLLAIALALIAFTQMPKIAANPLVGFASLAIVLVTLVGRSHLPFRIPGALGAVLVGCAVWYLMMASDSLLGTLLMPGTPPPTDPVWFPLDWLVALKFQWLGAMPEAITYAPYIVPFAIATVIGGIDCTESAASVGDDFNTNTVIGIEAAATILAAFCGGVIQTTPYIGHPAYKAMGGRAAYTLATALFVGGAGLIGYFGLVLQWIPEAAILPILVFIGIEITAQSFHATPKRHYAALAVACLPALAKLVTIYLGQYLAAVDFDAAVTAERVGQGERFFLEAQLLHLNVLAGGFIVTSLIWASATAKIIDRRFYSASLFFALGGMLVLFGAIHSPLSGDKMFLPWQLSDAGIFSEATGGIVINFAVAYLIMAVLMFVLGSFVKEPPIDDEPA